MTDDVENRRLNAVDRALQKYALEDGTKSTKEVLETAKKIDAFLEKGEVPNA